MQRYFELSSSNRFFFLFFKRNWSIEMQRNPFKINEISILSARNIFKDEKIIN